MLQKIETITKEQFLDEVNALGFKFPGAYISRGTGFDKSTVSKYLKGLERPSDKFLKAFYDWLIKSGFTTVNGRKLVEEDKTDKNDKDAKIVALENEILRLKLEKIETNLNEVLSNQKVLMSMLAVAMNNAVDFYAAGNKAKAADLKNKMRIDIAAATKSGV